MNKKEIIKDNGRIMHCLQLENDNNLCWTEHQYIIYQMSFCLSLYNSRTAREIVIKSSVFISGTQEHILARLWS